MIELLQQLLAAFSFAGLFGLIAMGISLIFGMTGIINFAQGDLLMVGAYVALLVTTTMKSLPLGIIAATVAVGLIGVLLYRGLFDHVRNDPISGFIISIGLIIVLENTVQEIASPEPRTYNSSLGAFKIGGVAFFENQLIVLGLCVVVLAGLLVLYTRTNFGRTVRACVEDKETASLMGINVRSVNVRVLGLAGCLAGLGGGLLITLFPIDPFVGSTLIINGFLAALLGGLRRVEGAVLGALCIGLVTGLNDQYGSSIWTPAVIYAVLIVVLLIRPTGLLADRKA
jgi:branched-chain amino acid transport system permease protein